MSDAPPPSAMHHEGSLAFRNAMKLAASLALTWGVALIVTFKLPNYLGTVFYGYYNYGEQYALSLAVFLGLGVDTYISREVAVRPKHATDFFAGVVLSRSLVLVPLVLYGWLSLTHKVEEERIATLLFAISQIFVVLNQSFQQTLQASSQVGGLAIANVVSKILWGGGVFAAVTLRAPFWVLPLPMVVSEAMKAGFLFFATRSAIGLELKLDIPATLRVLRISFPFFIANVAVTLGSTIDVVVLRELVPAGSEEVGLFSAAQRIARLSALFAPIMSGVLIPMMSRAKARSDQDFFAILRRGFEGVAVLSIPLTLLLALGADIAVRFALRPQFAPAAASLSWLAPTFVLSYANVLLWIALMILDRSWTITIISLGGLVMLPVFIVVIVPLTQGSGVGGAGIGCAIAMSARELVILLVFLAVLGRKALDQRAVANTLKSLLACVLVVGVDVALRRFGAIRLLIDASVYGVLVLVLRIVRVSDATSVIRKIRDRKKA